MGHKRLKLQFSLTPFIWELGVVLLGKKIKILVTQSSLFIDTGSRSSDRKKSRKKMLICRLLIADRITYGKKKKLESVVYGDGLPEKCHTNYVDV